MIIVRLSGGLGNQLFQYAAGRHFQKRRGGRLILSSARLAEPGTTPRNHELGAFHCAAEQPSLGLRLLLAAMTRRGWRSVLPALLKKLPSPWSFINEAQQTPSLTAGTIILDGYWQNWQLIQKQAPALLQELQPSSPLPACAASVLDAITRAPSSVAVHIRRGDYASRSETAAHHGVCPPSYYTAAVSHIASRTPGSQWFLFSDDPDWVESNRHLFPPSATIVRTNPDTPWVDLVLMSRCSHCVIANSTFSWWAAWLGPAQNNGIVIAPSRWFAQAPEPANLIPPNWLRLG